MRLPVSHAFQVMQAAPGRASRLVFASPHSGQIVPEDMRPAQAIDDLGLNSACDVAVDELLGEGPRFGIPLLAARLSRAYVDLNRPPQDIDPQLVADSPRDLRAGPKVRAGYGVVPRLAGNGQALYDRQLTMAEVQERIDRVHIVYHAALSELMQETRVRCGRAILIDWHSMPGRATGPGGPDVVLGDRYGSACHSDVTRQLRSHFEALGWRVGLNHPYAGGYSTQKWGRPDDGFEAIQVELSRKLYWDEAQGRRSQGWRRCQSGLNRVVSALSQSHKI